MLNTERLTSWVLTILGGNTMGNTPSRGSDWHPDHPRVADVMKYMVEYLIYCIETEKMHLDHERRKRDKRDSRVGPRQGHYDQAEYDRVPREANERLRGRDDQGI